jgi:hypothetical protein
MARFEPEEVIPFRLCYDAYVDPTRNPGAVREGLSKAFAALPHDAAPWQIVPLAFAAVASSAHHPLERIAHVLDPAYRDAALASVT